MADTGRANVNTLEPYWMPFTANRQFKSAPRMVVSAKDMPTQIAEAERLAQECIEKNYKGCWE